MSKQSETVKKWRSSCKSRIIEAMGGACCVCAYNKCAASLALHHLDSNEKDFGLGDIIANPVNWKTIVEELRKCVLVCQNCHGEIHANVSSVPESAPKFNEVFADYKELERQSKIHLNKCNICGKLKPTHKKYCSHSCASKSQYLKKWDDISLEKEILTKSILQIAKENNCSERTVYKRLKKLGWTPEWVQHKG